MTKRGFTIVEFMVITFIALIAIGMIALPKEKEYHYPQAGELYKWRGHDVTIIAADQSTNPTTYLIRLEDGKEGRAGPTELTQVVPVEKP